MGQTPKLSFGETETGKRFVFFSAPAPVFTGLREHEERQRDDEDRDRGGEKEAAQKRVANERAQSRANGDGGSDVDELVSGHLGNSFMGNMG
jgi:hypothetical protein